MNIRTVLLVFATLATLASWAVAEESKVPLSGMKQDSSAPLSVTADSLTVDQSTGTAIFTGNVVITQGELKLSTDRAEVLYAAGEAGKPGKIEQLLATGNVLLTTPTEAAEAEVANYSVLTSMIELTGNVVLTQNGSVLSGQKVTVNLTDGTAQAEGRVSTTFQAGATSP